ncbi:MAG: hypothetical protein NBV66_12430 [Burkholderiaceae bacterium]|nr:hypothetical protein [Burkholderiaceae bacterium]
MRCSTKPLIGHFIQKLRCFAGVAIAVLSVSSTISFAQTSPAEIEVLMDKCFDRKVVETRKLGGSVVGTMIPALLSECKKEIETSNNPSSNINASGSTDNFSSNLPACTGTDPAFWNMCQGSFTFNTGNKYVGEYQNGQRNGQGTFTFATGDKYVGEWKNNQFDGKGTATFVNGNKYVGEYKNGKRNGNGTLTNADGTKYSGEWKDGQRDGQGALTYADGRSETGTWQADKHIKVAEQAAVNSAATTAPSATLARSVPTEKSKLPPCRGTNKKAWNMCAGTETDSDGRKYVGEYADGEPSGIGTLYHPDGATVTGRWKNGQVDQLISCTGLPMCQQNPSDSQAQKNTAVESYRGVSGKLGIYVMTKMDIIKNADGKTYTLAFEGERSLSYDDVTLEDGKFKIDDKGFILYVRINGNRAIIEDQTSPKNEWAIFEKI